MLIAEAKNPHRRKKTLHTISQDGLFSLRATLASLILLLAVFLLTATTVEAGPAQGRTIFTMQCVSCHSITRPAKRPTIEEALGEKGPAMWYAGSKYKEGFIEAWLQNPKPIRGMEYNSLTEVASGGHMTLSSTEAAEVAAYLQEQKSPDVAEVEIKPKATVRGRFIFQKKLGCYGCHTIRRGSIQQSRPRAYRGFNICDQTAGREL